MADFLIMKTRGSRKIAITKVGEVPYNLDDLETGETRVFPSCAYDFINLDKLIGHSMWEGLNTFLLDHHIKHQCFIEAKIEEIPTVVYDQYGNLLDVERLITRYYVRIPDETHTVFFKMHWADQLSRVSRTG